MRPGFRTCYDRDVIRGLARTEAAELVTEQDLEGLPTLLQTYLRRVGVIGRPRVRSFRTKFSGTMRRSHAAGWMPIQAEQHTFLRPEPARLFLMKASVFGVPFEAFHRFVGPTATMQVRVLSLFQVVDANGPEMDQSETVTFFNDLCLLAPGALLEVDVDWEDVSARSLKGTFRHQGRVVTAVLHFDEHGDLVNFVSGDRFQSADGKSYVRCPWATPVSEYGSFSGFRLMAKADAIWQEPSGPYTYARFRMDELSYNVGQPSQEGTP